MKIYLTRHGQNIDNANGILNGHRDKPLTEVGYAQALELAKKILDSHLAIGKVFSSPLSRAYFTAEAVTDLLGLAKPEKIDLLIERDFGVMTGRLVNEIEALCDPDIIKTDTITYFLNPVGAETFPQLILRAKSLLAWLDGQKFDKDVLLVCHGDIGKMIYAAYYNMPWREVLVDFHFGNTEILLLDHDARQHDRKIMSARQYNF